MDKIQQHRESREAAIISAIRVIVDTVSENDEDARYLSSKYVIGIL